MRSWQGRLAARLPRAARRQLLRFEGELELALERFAAALPAGAQLLDAGAGEGQHRALFPHCRYIGVDLAVGDRAWDYSRLDVRADLEQLPFRAASFDAALNLVVLEHTRRPQRVLEELARVLKPGAQLLLAAPQEWAVHQSPHDYFRFTRHGLHFLLEGAGFVDIALAPTGGLFTLLGRRMHEAVLATQEGPGRLLFLPLAALLGPLGLLVPLLDPLDRTRDATLGYLCTARRGPISEPRG